jgi:hypothetical protein
MALTGTLLDLAPSTPDSAQPVKNSVSFYIRSFSMQISDLRYVLDDMMQAGHELGGRVFGWLERLEYLDNHAYVTLRYCGQTKNRPWDRHVSDIYSTSLSGFLPRFFKTVALYCPEVLSKASVQVVRLAGLEVKLHPAHVNLREQVLIALFGDGVLNAQAGGKDVSKFTEEDRTAFLSLESDTTNLLEAHTQKCPPAMQASIGQYIAQIQSYVETNPSTRGGVKYAFNDQIKNMLSQQAMPVVLSKSYQCAVMVTIGSDIGELHENHQARFFEAGGRAADAAASCYNHFVHWELGFGYSYDHTRTKSLVEAQFLPFVNTFPWFKKDELDYPAARDLLAQYLSHTRPLIVLTYGELVSFWSAYVELLTDHC